MRARNIKPSLFANEVLAFADPHHVLIFIGLWCIADRRGVLEDRAPRIHLQINPGRALEETVRSLNWLVDNGFLARYEACGIQCFKVLAFHKHQRPHKEEEPSTLPDLDGGAVLTPSQLRVNSESTPSQPELGTSQRALIPDPLFLIPDSGSLIPDSGSLIPDRGGIGLRPHSNPAGPRARVSTATPDNAPGWLAEFKATYPKRAGDPRWAGAVRAGHARIAEGHTPDEFIEGARRYAAFIRGTDKERTEFVQQASRFLGPDKPFMQAWNAPATKAEIRLVSNLNAADEFMRRTEKA